LTGPAQTVSGEITGKVSLKGAPPPEVKITLDATRGKLHTTPVVTRHYVVGTDGGLANVFVYIKKGLEGKRFALPKETPVLDQVDCIYNAFRIGGDDESKVQGQKFRSVFAQHPSDTQSRWKCGKKPRPTSQGHGDRVVFPKTGGFGSFQM
jgi:hypothetical protein